MKIIECLATFLTVAGFYLLSENVMLAGFATSLAANVLWVAWGAESKAWGIVVVNLLIGLSAVNGIVG